MNAPDINPCDGKPTDPASAPSLIVTTMPADYSELTQPHSLVGKAARRGHYMGQALDILQTQLSSVLGDGHQIRALPNIPRHRGTQVTKGNGKATGHSCGFDGLTDDGKGEPTYEPNNCSNGADSGELLGRNRPAAADVP